MESVEYKYIYYTIDTENFNKEKIKTKNIKNEYIILNNDKTVITENDEDVTGLYRSIILDSETNDIVCFSPPNSIEINSFIKKYPDYGNFIYTNEIIEGTMINLFYNKRQEKWEISTRSSIGGNSWFYRNNYNLDESDPPQKTFRQMFLDAFGGEDLNENSFISELPKNYSYSFVLQHPDNHIVQDIYEPTAYLIAVYELNCVDDHQECETEKDDRNSRTVKVIPPPVYEKWDCLKPIYTDGFTNPKINIYYPKRYLTKSYSDFLKIMTAIHTDKFNMGIMVTNLMTNVRTSIPNIAYEELKKIRGNNPNLQYHYFSLSQEQKQEFLYHFPRYIRLFNQFNNQYQEFITIVHQAYFSYYVKKEGIEIAKKFFIHASRIHHQYFLPSVNSGQKMIITRPVVKEYFDNMKPNEILYFLYYDKRQVALEIKRNKMNETKIEETNDIIHEIIEEVHINKQKDEQELHTSIPILELPQESV